MPREILPRPVSERDVSILIASGKQSQIMATMECITLRFPHFIRQVSWPHVCLLAAVVAVLMGFASPWLLIFLINGAGDFATCVYINNSSSNTCLFKWLLLYVFWKLTNLQCLVDKQLRTKSGNSPLPNLCTFLVVLRKEKEENTNSSFIEKVA